ncbi:hypothetical protein QT381_00780 [Galbitalea sp. SE-J8]|uniref:hypothetical protein n=1 Tax=Galbitalea sp. SE-J8 TaxID=3054952 RepID=UPI00259CD2AC|nr:hypothetical protein [Galbitalea sp. SE-J8]MDM4761543.1 hypothetical protein [Galbitalea sp. SE-J8]
MTLRLTMVGLGADISGTLAARDAGAELHVDLELENHVDFDRNRIGLVALHPLTVAGSPLRVRHPSGATTETAFPVHVAPDQPARDISGLTWRVGNREHRLRFDGDVFEMEDQRNWTDASFKTYSTPLERPAPVMQRAGTTVHQSLVLASEPAPSAERATRLAASPPEPPIVRFQPTDRPVPAIGIATTTHWSGHGWSRRASPASTPQLDFVLVEVDARADSVRGALERATGEANGAPLDVRIVADDASHVERAVAELPAQGVVRVGVFSARTHATEPALWAALQGFVRRRALDVELIAGTRGHFAELNRLPVGAVPEDVAMTFGASPQVHERSRAQLVESLAVQGTVTGEAARIAKGAAVHVGPVTLLPRFIATEPLPPVVAGPFAGSPPGSTDIDARQWAPALAAWTIGSAASLAGAGAASIAYFETTGPRGVRDEDGDAPVAAALAALREISGWQLLEPSGQVDRDVWLIAAQEPSSVRRRVALVANLAATVRTVVLERRRVRVPSASWIRIESDRDW